MTVQTPPSLAQSLPPNTPSPTHLLPETTTTTPPQHGATRGQGKISDTLGGQTRAEHWHNLMPPRSGGRHCGRETGCSSPRPRQKNGPRDPPCQCCQLCFEARWGPPGGRQVRESRAQRRSLGGDDIYLLGRGGDRGKWWSTISSKKVCRAWSWRRLRE